MGSSSSRWHFVEGYIAPLLFLLGFDDRAGLEVILTPVSPMLLLPPFICSSWLTCSLAPSHLVINSLNWFFPVSSYSPCPPLFSHSLPFHLHFSLPTSLTPTPGPPHPILSLYCSVHPCLWALLASLLCLLSHLLPHQLCLPSICLLLHLLNFGCFIICSLCTGSCCLDQSRKHLKSCSLCPIQVVCWYTD